MLREAPAPEPRPEFVADLRERLMAAADTLLVPSDEARLTLPARRPARERKIIAAVAGVAIVGSSASMAVAAQSALPGDALYPVKRIIEDVQAGIRVGDAQKGATLLTNAEGRLDEVRELSRTGALEDGPAIADTLNAFTEQSTEASDLLLSDYAETGDEGSIRDLRDFTSGSMQSLAELEPQVPIEARDELLHAAQVLSQIDTEAERACAACGGPGINQLPAILASAGYAADASAPFTGILVPTRTDAQEARRQGRQEAGRQGAGAVGDRPGPRVTRQPARATRHGRGLGIGEPGHVRPHQDPHRGTPRDRRRLAADVQRLGQRLGSAAAAHPRRSPRGRHRPPAQPLAHRGLSVSVRLTRSRHAGRDLVPQSRRSLDHHQRSR